MNLKWYLQVHVATLVVSSETLPHAFSFSNSIVYFVAGDNELMAKSTPKKLFMILQVKSSALNSCMKVTSMPVLIMKIQSKSKSLMIQILADRKFLKLYSSFKSLRERCNPKEKTMNDQNLAAYSQKRLMIETL